MIATGQRADAETGMAKVFASETGLYCALESMRVHGGYGYSTEFESSGSIAMRR